MLFSRINIRNEKNFVEMCIDLTIHVHPRMEPGREEHWGQVYDQRSQKKKIIYNLPRYSEYQQLMGAKGKKNL